MFCNIFVLICQLVQFSRMYLSRIHTCVYVAINAVPAAGLILSAHQCRERCRTLHWGGGEGQAQRKTQKTRTRQETDRQTDTHTDRQTECKCRSALLEDEMRGWGVSVRRGSSESERDSAIVYCTRNWFKFVLPGPSRRTRQDQRRLGGRGGAGWNGARCCITCSVTHAGEAACLSGDVQALRAMLGSTYTPIP